MIDPYFLGWELRTKMGNITFHGECSQPTLQLKAVFIDARVQLGGLGFVSWAWLVRAKGVNDGWITRAKELVRK